MPADRPSFPCEACGAKLLFPVYPRLPKPGARTFCPRCRLRIDIPPWPEDVSDQLEDVDEPTEIEDGPKTVYPPK
jgi:hypothetical protein